MSYQVIDILTDVGNTYILSEPSIREMYCYDFFIKIDWLVQEGQYFLDNSWQPVLFFDYVSYKIWWNLNN